MVFFTIAYLAQVRILLSTPYESWDCYWFSPLLLKTIKFIRRHFQARNLNCAAAEVTEANLKTSACLFAFCRRKYFFAYVWQLKVFRFRFKSAEWTGNFLVCSPEVSLRIIRFRRPFGPPVWNFGRPRINRSPGTVGVSCDRAPLRQQPCEFKPISIFPFGA